VFEVSSDDWFVGFHEGLVARFWRAAGEAMADGDARLVLELLGPRPLRVLDMPCGNGRITARVAAAGHEAVGVDIAPAEVEEARAAVPDARFEVGDLRSPPDLGAFDAVVSWGNSFGYLRPDQTAACLASFHGALRPGGRLVLESLTVAESFLPGGVKERAEYEFGGIRMLTVNAYRAAESRLETELTLSEGDVVEHAQSIHHVHTTGEVVRMLRGAGFREVDLLSAPGVPYELGAPRMIAVAVR
jgi:SAM-dependent methyltransferase